MGRIFVTSDTHYYHNKIIKYCDRPFQTVEEMNQTMINRWNETVSKDDIVIHLGDVCFAKLDQIKSVFNQLNARKKILIAGNHDCGYHNLDISYWKNIFDEVYQYYEIKYRSIEFVLFHFPMKAWNRKYHGSIHLHGHIHSLKQEETDELIYDVGVDANDFAPVDLNYIISEMEKRKIKNNYK